MSDNQKVRVRRRRRRRDKRRVRRRIFASRYFNVFLRLTFGPAVCRRYRLRVHDRDKVLALKPPYVVMGNHGSVWDPFFVNNFIPHPIHYVVSDSNFRSRIMSFALSLVGSIPKTKVMSDLETVKNIVRVKDRNGIVGIFPEGQSTWDGTTLPIYSATAKLLKVLRVPVVFARISGAFLSRPRWSRKPRFGHVDIHYTVGFNGPELRKMPVADIHARIKELLGHDDVAENRTRRVRYRGISRAEYMEIVLFLCPECHSLGTMHSHAHRLTCSSCGYSVFVDEYGLFEQRSETFHFDSIHDWNVWQTEKFYSLIDAYCRSAGEEPLISDDGVTVETGFKSMPTKKIAHGTLQLFSDRIEIHAGGSPITIDIVDIEGINVQNRERLEFYAEDTLYKITIDNPRGCTYKSGSSGSPNSTAGGLHRSRSRSGHYMKADTTKLREIIGLDSELNKIQDVDILLERILSEARRVVSADAGSIYLKKEDKLFVAYAQNDTKQDELPPGRKLIYNIFTVPIDKTSISGYVAATGEPLNIPDVYEIPEGAEYAFRPYYDRIAQYRSKSTLTIPLRSNVGDTLGVIQIWNKKTSKGKIVEFDNDDELMIMHFATNATVALQRAQMTRAILLRMIRMAELRDPKETGPHVNRVAGYAIEIYEHYASLNGTPQEEIEKVRDNLRMAAMLHDVGKVAISDMILKKPGRLTADEFLIMKTHTWQGARLFMDKQSEFDDMAQIVAFSHHENWDGSGYPGHVNIHTGQPLDPDSKGNWAGKKGDEIPLYGRIVALADVYDALRSRRVYKDAWTEEEALEEIKKEAGTKFDPDLMDCLVEVLPSIRTIQEKYRE